MAVRDGHGYLEADTHTAGSVNGRHHEESRFGIEIRGCQPFPALLSGSWTTLINDILMPLSCEGAEIALPLGSKAYLRYTKKYRDDTRKTAIDIESPSSLILVIQRFLGQIRSKSGGKQFDWVESQ